MVFKKGHTPVTKGKTKLNYPKLSHAGVRIGCTSWNKGLTKETDKRVLKYTLPKIGRKRSSDTINKIVESKRKNYKKEKHYNYGKTLSDITKNKIKMKHLGTKLSDNHKLKIKIALIGKNKGKKHSIETINKMKVARANKILPFKDSSIEKKIQNFLTLLHKEYIAHKYISKITHSYQCDIFLPIQEEITQETIIECDGCFFHACPICKLKEYEWTKERRVKDEIRTKELLEKGYKVIRLWEHDIRKMTLQNFKDKMF